MKNNLYQLEHLFLSHSEDLIICVSMTHEILEFNKIAENFLKISREQALGKNLFVLSQQQRIQLPFNANTLKVAMHQPPCFIEGMMSDADQNQHPMHWKYIYTPSEQDQNDYYVILGKDISELTLLKKEIEQLTLAKEKAKAADRERKNFLASMSHDIKTPIAGIISTAEYLMDIIAHPEHHLRMNSIVQSGLCLLDLINEIIESSRTQAHEKVHPVRFKLKELTESIEKLMQPIIQNKGLSLDIHTSHAIPNFLIGDRTRLYRVLINLVSNAIKFTNQGSVTIRLELSKETAHNVLLKIGVKDTGIGIPKDKQKHIFEKFAQLNTSSEKIHQGSGLGLHIVSEFVEAMKGKINVMSEEGKGSEFICLIPFKKDDMQEEILTENEAHSLNTSTFKTSASIHEHPLSEQLPLTSNFCILLIEDNEIAARAASDILKSFGGQVTIAHTGKMGLDLFENQSYDLVYMDLGLPDMKGIEVAKELCRLKKIKAQTMPVFALSAHIDIALIEELMETGLDAVYSKPLLKQQAIKDLQSISSLNIATSPLPSLSKNISPQKNTLPIIDLELGAKIVNLDENQAKILLHTFLKRLPNDLKEIKQAYTHRHLPKFIHILHTLHGSLCYCGAPRLKNFVQHMEVILKAGDIQQWDMLYEQFLKEVNSLKNAYYKL